MRVVVNRRVALLALVVATGLGVAACTPPPPPPSTTLAAPPTTTPTTPPTTTPTTPPNATPATPLLNGIWQATNEDRAANGLPALTYDTQLASLAQDWANHLAATETLVHRDLSAVLADPAYAGFWTLGENLLDGPNTMTATQMEQAWMNSTGHRANILSGSYNVMGTGVAYSPDGQVWAVVNFGGVH